MKAQRVSAATDVIAENAVPSVGLNGENATESKKKSPTMAIPTNGTSLAMVVSNCTIPAGRIPAALIAVRIPNRADCDGGREQRVISDGGPEITEVAGECDRNRGIARPYRDPVAPRDLKTDDIAETGPAVGVWPTDLRKRSPRCGFDGNCP
jgi:hypothetical protein